MKASNDNILKAYLSLTKPGIVRGNALTAIAGFFLASMGNIDFGLLLAMLVGLSLIIASACVFNNYLDQGIDAKMKRTKQRALVSGVVSNRSAIIFGLVLGSIGAAILETFTNLLTLWLALFGFVAYVVIYGVGKRKTVHGTVIGSISGAVPPVVGYTSVSGSVDTAAVILFFIVVFWQMPHFYAIAMFRSRDYAAAGIPVLPLKSGVKNTKIQIMLYIIAFTISSILLTILGYLSLAYAAVALALGLYWLRKGCKGFNADDDIVWARRMFLFSLIVISVLCVTIVIDASFLQAT